MLFRSRAVRTGVHAVPLALFHDIAHRQKGNRKLAGYGIGLSAADGCRNAVLRADPRDILTARGRIKGKRWLWPDEKEALVMADEVEFLPLESGF